MLNHSVYKERFMNKMINYEILVPTHREFDTR